MQEAPKYLQDVPEAFAKRLPQSDLEMDRQDLIDKHHAAFVEQVALDKITSYRKQVKIDAYKRSYANAYACLFKLQDELNKIQQALEQEGFITMSPKRRKLWTETIADIRAKIAEQRGLFETTFSRDMNLGQPYDRT